MGAFNNSVSLKKMNHNGVDVKKWWHNGVLVFSAGAIVTYMVDTNLTYTEEVGSGESCLNPTSFIPSKDGWTFIGWREDTTADNNVLTEKIAESDPITLYAVYQKPITLSYDGSDATSGSVDSQTKNAYYNYGNTFNPTFVIADNGYVKADHTFNGWDIGAVGTSIKLSEDTVAYAQWTRIPAEAFYLQTDVLGLTGIITELENGQAAVIHRPTSGEGWWTVRVTHTGGGASHMVDSIANVNRKHCNRVKFSVGWHDGVTAIINIGGVAYDITGWGEHIVDISSVTDDIISVSLNTGYSESEHGVQISTPYFYGE